MHGQINAGHGQFRLVVKNDADVLQHAVRVQNRGTNCRSTNGKLLITISLRIENHIGCNRFDLVCIELFESSLAHYRILPALRRAMLEVRFVLNVIKIGAKLAPIRRQRADVVALLVALAVDAEAVWEVDVPSLPLLLVLRMERQPLDVLSYRAGGLLGILYFLSGIFGHFCTSHYRIILYGCLK